MAKTYKRAACPRYDCAENRNCIFHHSAACIFRPMNAKELEEKKNGGKRKERGLDLHSL